MRSNAASSFLSSAVSWAEYVGFDLHMMLNNLVYERQSTLC